MTQQNIGDRDYFTDEEILKEPHEYFRRCLARSAVYDVPGRDYMMVTGFNECIEVVRNTEDFSSILCFSPYGAGLPLPFNPEGDDISGQIEARQYPARASISPDTQFISRHYHISASLSRRPGEALSVAEGVACKALVYGFSVTCVHSGQKFQCNLLISVTHFFSPLIISLYNWFSSPHPGSLLQSNRNLANAT